MEGIDVAGAAMHVQEDHILRTRGNLRFSCRKRIPERSRIIATCSVHAETVAFQHAGKSQSGEPATGLPE